MRTVPRLLVAILVAAIAAGCADTTAEDVAATVDGTDIARDDLEDQILAMLDDEMPQEERADMIELLQREILGLRIQDTIYANVLAEEGVDFDDSHVEAAREARVEEFGGEENYELQLQTMGVSPELFEMIVVLEARHAALQHHFAESEEARGVRHILVETEDEADELVAQLADGADFGALAEEHSQDPGSVENGGAYPPMPRGAWVEEFEQAVWEADLDEVLGPVETMHGFHVIEVTEETELLPADMDPQQLQQMTGEAVGAILSQAFESAEVTIAATLGTWDTEQFQVVAPDSPVGEAPDGSEMLPEE